MPATRIPRVFNPNYQRNGTKSYVWLMSKYGFVTTREGPYFRGSLIHEHGKFAHRHVIRKRHGHPKLDAAPSHGSGDPSSGSGTTESSTTPMGVGGRVHISHFVAKRDTKGDLGQISAEDIQLDSEYVCPVQIGTPAQTLMLDFDTGSSDLWVWSTSLPESTQSSGASAGHTIFNPSQSSTWEALKGYKWQISYGDGSSASGTVGTDNISLGAVMVKGQAVEISSKMSVQFQQDSGDGLLGLAWPSINTITPEPQPTPVANMITQQDIPASAELFTAYLGSWRDSSDPDKGQSFYTFGEIDQDVLNGQTPAYTAINNSQGFWLFDSTTATVNGETVTRPSGNTAIADTGTTLCLVDDATVEAIYKAIPGSKYDSTQQGYTFPSDTTADKLPDVAFPCGDTLIHIQKEYLAFADAGNGMAYGGIQSRGQNPFDILGDVWLKNAYVVFDQGNTRIGVVQRTEPTQNLTPPPAQGGGS